MIEEVIRPVFNMVYDVWDGDKPIPNLLTKFPNKQLSDPEFLLLHYQNDASKEYKFEKKKYRIEDVSLYPNENFYYLIDYGGNLLSEFLLNDEKFGLPPEKTDPLSDIVKRTLEECNNFKIIFITEHEPDNEKSFIMIMNYIKENNFDPNQFYLINNNSLIYEYPKKFNFNINVHQLDFISHSSTKVLSFIGGCNFIPNKDGKFFMCFNKSPKVHRYALLCLLKKSNMLENINWSLVPSWNAQPNESFYTTIFDKKDIEKYKNEINFFEKVSIKRSDYEEDKGWFNEYQHINNKDFPLWLQIPEYAKNYESSYVNIVTESKFLDIENNIHISEKSFRPFFYYQFPLILASRNHIKKMKEKFDLDFFDDILNHSYDSHPNQRIRLEMFFNELTRLYNNKSKLIEFYNKNYERFEANKQKVLKILEIVNKDYYYLENLI
jgi:hypothetical protein